MSVKIVVGNIYSRIYGEINENILFILNYELSYKLKNAYYILQTKKDDDWDGTVNLFWGDRGNAFYTGMMSDVLAILRSGKIKYEIEDRRVCPEKNMPEILHCPANGKELRPYQEFTVNKCIKATRGIIQTATGSGKTYIASKLIAAIKTKPFIFFVLSQDLLDQAHYHLSANLNVPIGKVGAGVVDIKDVNVVMVQTAIRAIRQGDPKFDPSQYAYDDEDDWSDNTVESSGKGQEIRQLIKTCKGFYLDEVHHAASKTAKDVIEAASQAYWKFGGSATPFREDGAEKMIKALFGQNLVKISASWLIRNKYLVKPYIFNIIMPGNRGKFLTYNKIYENYISANPDLNDLVAKLVKYFKRLSISTLVLVQRYNHGDAIVSRVPDIPFIKGSQSGNKRRASIGSLRDGGIPAAVATTLADEGLDVERLGSVVIAGGGKSITRVYQRVGRALRKFEGKNIAIVILFHHKVKYLDAHGKRVKNILKKETEFVVTDSTPESIINDIDAIVKPVGGLFD